MVAFGKFVSKLRSNTQGNAMIIVAAGAPLLIGGAGFAVDTAQWYMWEREMQHAVDQAAYAGAWARADSESEDDYAIRARQEYDANMEKVAAYDTEPTISIADFGDGEDNSVVVVSSATRELPFTSFFTNSAVTIRVSAQATFHEGANYNACLVSLADAGTGTDIGGTSIVSARCGLAALSCSEDAITIDSNATVETDSIAACGTIDIGDNEELESVRHENVDGLVDIYSHIEPPTNDTARSYNCSGKGRNKQASLLPGTYSSIVSACDTVFAPGIYVIDGGTLDLTANSSLTGNGVMFVLKNGAHMKFGGSGNSNALNLTPPTAADFIGTSYESQADDLAGILVFEHRDNNATQEHVMNGNSESLIEGLIYLPDGDLKINGTADIAAQCLKVTSYRMRFIGTASLETLCPIDDSTNVGGSTAIVRLVA
jgi:Flp pilus assembly protein TadG